MSHRGSFLGSVAKTVLVGLVASYAIRFIQSRIDAMHGDGEEGEESGEDESAGSKGEAQPATQH